MSEKKSFIKEIKTHWKEPDIEHGKYVPYKEYGSIFLGVAMNYGVQAPLKFISFAASCYLIMYHYNLPYISFSVITLIGLPLSYLWNILSWVVTDNLGFLEKKIEKKYLSFYGAVSVLGILIMIFDISKFAPESFVNVLDGITGINAMSFFKIIGVQLFINAYGGARSIIWRKLLVPKFGRYKYSLFANYFQKCAIVILIGWLPVASIKNVNQRLWIAYLLFSLFTMFDFSNVIENCTDSISPNPQERLWVRTWPVKISHLLENAFEVIIPLFGIGFMDIRLYKYVVPAVFIPLGAITLLCTRNIKERIPQPPIDKKQKISFWYGVSQVLKNKYRWLDMISSMIDSLGNGALDITAIIYFYSMRLYTQCVLYGIIKLIFSFRTTPTSFLAPIFIRKFSYRSMRLFRQFCLVLKCILSACAIYFFKENQTMCGILILGSEFITSVLSQPCNVAGFDMNIRLKDYQMYISGERLEASSGVFSWLTAPVTTVVSLLIPYLILKSGFNSNWDVLFIDSCRFKILAVPIIFDLIGHILMIIPYLFWDYNNEQHQYVIEVLKQREKLAESGYFPDEYEGGLKFSQPQNIKNNIPVNAMELLEKAKVSE